MTGHRNLNIFSLPEFELWKDVTDDWKSFTVKFSKGTQHYYRFTYFML